ncbi:DNA/RNA non-specific endonuclease [Jannaschia sp. CCS1]|uniref:DNA/RNA non-specific endonuclease n=1 Tax=Jannaschia sp. (strain CCS1) TaxID=290400 RepID=UPI000053A0AE|nr:DNA/RNA non-specific endonuclease [Jannaschia sp. CCS1]ABD56498.1 DNA/RNA non-specific endonuclease [Jannaschia sp. CCS1]
MDHQAQQQLKAYLEGLIPEAKLDAMADDSEAPMRMAGTQEIKKTKAARAQAALQKLASNRDINDEEQFLIEAIILPDKRPVIDIRNGGFSVQHPLWLKYNVDKAVEDNIERAIRGVGRIEVPMHPQIPYAGTGFLVGHNLMMTNRHVAQLFAEGLGDGPLRFQDGQTAAIDFVQEVGNATAHTMQVTRVRMIHPFWDMAVLEVEDVPQGVEPLALSLTNPANLQGRDIAVIGYPAFDHRNNVAVQNEVFRGIYNVKRLQPGLLKPRAVVSSFGNRVDTVTHDASTLGGNSGSCVLDVTSGEVVALHFAGRYKVANYAVPTFELSRDARVDALQLEFGEDATSNVEDPDPWQPFWDTTEAARQGDAGSSAITVQTPTGAATGARSVSVTIPVTVTVDIGAPSHATAAVPMPATERMVEPKHDPDYARKPGYDADFLGLAVPMPKPTNPDDLSTLDDSSTVLDYVHFSLVMNKRRRLAQISAANVDASPARVRPEPGRDYTRGGLNGFTSGNDRERWFTDPRILGQHQLPDRFFTRDRTAFDKGHIVRRNAIVWGDTYAEVQNANGDSFHVTNCSPQVKGFNRSNLGGLWGRLENVVLKEAATERLCVFAGPILKDDDPVFVGVDDVGVAEVRIPRAYWKVIVAESDGALQAFGYLLEQDLSDVDFELQLAPEWQRRLTPLDKLQDRIGTVTFDPVILAADQA